MAKSLTWFDAMRLSLTTTTPWTTPSAEWVDAAGFSGAFIALDISAFIGAGTATATLQSAVYPSNDDNAWVDLASQSGIGAAGPVVLMVPSNAATPLTGSLRLKITCTGGDVTLALRCDLLLKGLAGYQLVEWLVPVSVAATSGSDSVMPAEQWLDVGEFLSAYVLCEFRVSAGTASNFTVKLQTAANRDADADSWVQVGSSAMSSSSRQIDGTSGSATPPMGVLRLAYASASGTTAGVLRVTCLLKDS